MNAHSTPSLGFLQISSLNFAMSVNLIFEFNLKNQSQDIFFFDNQPQDIRFVTIQTFGLLLESTSRIME
jgi:hypothetical protein